MLSPNSHSSQPVRPTAAPKAISTVPRELESRSANGIEVRLLWHPNDGHVSVEVCDTRTCEAFELHVREGERALDVFRHPFAYAGLDGRP
jgi:hypothetical protein